MGEFSMQPYWVTEDNFLSCNTTSGVPVISQATNHSFTVPQSFLRPGINYFIGKISTALRVRVDEGMMDLLKVVHKQTI